MKDRAWCIYERTSVISISIWVCFLIQCKLLGTVFQNGNKAANLNLWFDVAKSRKAIMIVVFEVQYDYITGKSTIHEPFSMRCSCTVSNYSRKKRFA